MVQVFLPNQSDKTDGDSVSRQHATDLVEQGLARWINRGTCIRLTSYRKSISGASCMVGKAAIEGNAMGKRQFVELVDALRQSNG